MYALFSFSNCLSIQLTNLHDIYACLFFFSRWTSTWEVIKGSSTNCLELLSWSWTCWYQWDPRSFSFFIIYMILRVNCTLHQVDCNLCHFAIVSVENRFAKVWKWINTCVFWDEMYTNTFWLKTHTMPGKHTKCFFGTGGRYSYAKIYPLKHMYEFVQIFPNTSLYDTWRNAILLCRTWCKVTKVSSTRCKVQLTLIWWYHAMP